MPVEAENRSEAHRGPSHRFESNETMYPKLASKPLVFAGVFGVYFALGQLGFAFSPLPHAPVVWPPSGFALAMVLLFGRGIWVPIMAGALAVHSASVGSVQLGLVLASAETLEAVIGAALIERFANGIGVFRSSRTIFRFVAISAIASTTVSASWGTVAVILSKTVTWGDFSDVWLSWWQGHLAGILVVTPLVLLWATTPLRRPRPLRALEGASFLLLLLVVSQLVFVGLFPSDVKDYPLEFLCLPLVLWVGFRFELREVATTIAILSATAVYGTGISYGPFVQSTPNESLVLLQAYTSVLAVAGMVLGAIVFEKTRAESRLRELAITDPLTGLANYRQLLDVLRREITRSSRTTRSFAVLFLDVDRLKAINDRHGHLAGSRALCRVGDVLRKTCRAIDTPSRYGGDEFAIVMPETGDEGGRALLGRVEQRLAELAVKPGVTVSGGIAVYPRDGHSPTLLLRAADAALYRAKAIRHRELDRRAAGEARAAAAGASSQPRLPLPPPASDQRPERAGDADPAAEEDREAELAGAIVGSSGHDGGPHLQVRPGDGRST